MEESWRIRCLIWGLMILIQVHGYECCLEKERMGLLEFKGFLESNNEDADRLLPSWVNAGRESDCCSWERVVCNSTTGAVTHLSLNNIRQIDFFLRVYGHAPSKTWSMNVSLFHPFEELVTLDLSENWFTDYIENEGFEKLKGLKKLEMLNVGLNNFNKSIFPSVGTLTSLRVLILRQINLEGSNLERDLANLTNLEVLDIGNTESLNIEGLGSGKLPKLEKLNTLMLDSSGIENYGLQSLRSLTSLKNLSLASNQLSDFNFSELDTLQNLETLDISGNGLTANEMVKGLKSISKWKKLATLDLSGNQLDNSIFQSLSAALPTLHNLLTRWNNFQVPLPTKEISNFKDLEMLDLSGNGLSGYLHIQELANMSNLKTLILRENQLSGFQTAPGLVSFKNLELLDLTSNDFTGSIPPCIWNLTSLQALSLADNQLTGTLLIEGFCKLKNLQELDLSGNSLDGTLPPCLSNMKSLKLLDLSSNQFTGNIPSILVTNLKSLEYFDLGDNRLEGPFALSEFYNHSKLEVLVLSSNNRLEVETEITSWMPRFELKILSLSYCNLNKQAGIILQFLSQQRNLIVLDLSHNDLKDEFPSVILENNTRLEYLNLRNNSLRGQFPLPAYPNIYTLWVDASHNLFGGRFNAKINEIFPYLRYLNLSANGFEGHVPSSIGNLSTLEALDLSNNNFSGEVPLLLLERCPRLYILNLSNNKLHGPIFSTQFSMSELSFLGLNDNNFTGTLSSGLSECRRLNFLDLSNNHMSGEIPAWMANLTNMRALILRNNSFHGQVPNEFPELSVLDLSHNLFSGSLPLFSVSKFAMHVHLKGNRYTGLIPEDFLDSSKLLTLDLGGNNLSGNIPKSFSAFSDLKIFSLRENNFSGQIPEFLCQLNKISIMDLSTNNFFGTIPQCFKNLSFGNREFNEDSFRQDILMGIERFVTYIYRGRIERDLYKIREKGEKNDHQVEKQDQFELTTKNIRLTYKGNILNFMSGLDLSRNSLTGEIPYELGHLSSIRALNLSYNHLNGLIPQSFSDLSSLESLDLSYNSLSGGIPSQLADLNFLGVFTVAHNNLSGQIPDKNQFWTFEQSSYEGNPFLCGSMIKRKCYANEPSPSPTAFPDESEGKWHDIDPAVFFASFGASYAVILLGFATLLIINPHWRWRWFNLIEECLEEVWELKPLVNGKEIMHALQLKSGGPLLRDWQHRLIQWQLAHPSGTAEEFLDWMRQKRAKREYHNCSHP